jgi:PAS domain S-box-containing protein
VVVGEGVEVGKVAPLRVLLAEDSANDAAMIDRHLHATGRPIELMRVETAATLRDALETKRWDLVICDWSMPGFNAPDALAIVKQLKLDIPFIIVSGTVGETSAVEAMRAGAHDYVLKNNLARLAPAIERELRESIVREAHRQAETALRISDFRFKRLAESGIVGIAVADLHRKVHEANDAYLKMVGYTREELKAGLVDHAELIAPEWRAVADEAVEHLRALGATPPWESAYLRRDGSRLSVLQGAALLDPVTCITFAADLTERKHAEEERHRGLLEAAPDAMVVVNQAGEIVLLNLQAEKQFGYRRDELLGQQVKNIIPQGFAERLAANGTGTTPEALSLQIGTGIELTGRRKDGTEFPIEIMLSPLHSPEGVVVTAAIRNISVRKEAERHLAQVEDRYRGLLEAAPDAMVLVNQSGEIVLVNLEAEKQFGYRRDELVGKQVKTIIPSGLAPRPVTGPLRSTVRPPALPAHTGVELCGHRKDGTDFPIEITVSPLESSEGILMTVAIRDITARKKVEALLLQTVKELNHSNEDLGQFAYIASHDLQEPLRMVASYTGLLSKRYKGKLDAEADEFIAFAMDGATRMQGLIQDLLAYSRVGTKGKDPADTSSEDALGKAIMNLRGAIDASGALVTHDLLPPVLADESQLIQLFQNLVGNAIKYQRPGVPLVHVSSVKNDETKWTFSVKDNGLGIESQYFEKIFGMFQRLHSRQEFTGTGIGLAICKRIVERHGGSISVESQPGQGSTFHFSLPAGHPIQMPAD